MNRGSGGGTGGGGGGGGGVFDKSIAKAAKNITETSTPAKKATQRAAYGAGAAATAATTTTTTARPSFLKRAEKPVSSTDHKIPRARAGTVLKKQPLRRDPRGRIIYRGSQDFEAAGPSKVPVPVVEPPPGRLVGNADRIARPRDIPYIGKENTSNVEAGKGIARQSGGGSNGGDAGGGARDSLRYSPRDGGKRAAGAGEPPNNKGGSSVASLERVAVVAGESAAAQQQLDVTLPQGEQISARIGVGGEGAHGSTTALTAIPLDSAATRVAVKKNHVPQEVETQQDREHAQERGRERERDGNDASETEEESSAQPHERDGSEDESDYGGRETDQNCSNTDDDAPPWVAAGSGEVEELVRLTPPKDQPSYENETAEEPAATGLGSIATPSGGG